MVKKKSPVIPLTVVAVMVAVAFAVNTQLRPKTPDEIKQEEAAKSQSSTQSSQPMRAPDKNEELKMAMQKSMQGQNAPGGPKLGKPTDPDAQGGIMVGRKQEPYHPKPSASSTDSGWYFKR